MYYCVVGIKKDVCKTFQINNAMYNWDFLYIIHLVLYNQTFCLLTHSALKYRKKYVISFTMYKNELAFHAMIEHTIYYANTFQWFVTKYY